MYKKTPNRTAIGTNLSHLDANTEIPTSRATKRPVKRCSVSQKTNGEVVVVLRATYKGGLDKPQCVPRHRWGVPYGWEVSSIP